MNLLLQRLVALLPRLQRHPALIWFVALALSVAKSLQTGHWQRFRYDRDGLWIHQQGDVMFFAPSLHTPTLETITQLVDDQWCHGISLAEGDVVVDVGAGVGDETLVFSRRVGSTGRVIAIEAHPKTADCLERTVAFNRLENVSIFHEAACDKETMLLISDDADHEANALVVVKGRASIAVPGRPVDIMLAALSLRRIKLLKMNIEGAEAMALAGMRNTLGRTLFIVVSCHDFLATGGNDDPMRTKAAVMRMLSEAGFLVSTRPDAPRKFMRDFVYGRREKGTLS